MSTATARRLGSHIPLDVAIAAVALAGSLAQVWHGGITPIPSGPGRFDLIGVALVVGSTAPLIAWRRSPLGVFVATAAAGIALVGLGYPLDVPLGPAVALYLLAANRAGTPRMRYAIVAAIGLVVVALGAAVVWQGIVLVTALLHAGLAWAVAWFAGERTRLQRERIAELNDRAVRAEREAERERLLAGAEERARIARDLHDSAGHAINVIAVRAGAARLRHHQDPDRSLHALMAIEEVARQTAGEIDHMVGALRHGGSPDGIESPIGLASLDTLIAHHRAAGLEVTLGVSGAPGTLGGAVDQAAYRILQEALTNAARHGAGSAQVELAFGAAAVQLTVTNPVATHRSPSDGRGHGLIGMRERATLLGGALDTERADGTFRVRAWVPYGGHPS